MVTKNKYGNKLIIISPNNIDDNNIIYSMLETQGDIEAFEDINEYRESLKKHQELNQSKFYENKIHKSYILDKCIDGTEDLDPRNIISYSFARARSLCIPLLVLSVNKLSDATCISRGNATDIIIWKPNEGDLNKIAREYGICFNGYENFLKKYNDNIKDDDFCYLDILHSPPIMYKNFDKEIDVGNKYIEVL